MPPANSHPYRRSHSSHSVAETSFHSQLVLPEPICCCHGHHYVPEERLPAANGQLSGLVLSLRGYGNQKTPLRNSCRRAPERNHAISASSNQVWSSSSTRLLGLHVLDRRSQAVRRQESVRPLARARQCRGASAPALQECLIQLSAGRTIPTVYMSCERIPNSCPRGTQAQGKGASSDWNGLFSISTALQNNKHERTTSTCPKSCSIAFISLISSSLSSEGYLLKNAQAKNLLARTQVHPLPVDVTNRYSLL